MMQYAHVKLNLRWPGNTCIQEEEEEEGEGEEEQEQELMVGTVIPSITQLELSNRWIY